MAVALIAIGPKDLPVAIRTVTGLIKKARGLAAEFQGHVDEMMREANVDRCGERPEKGHQRDKQHSGGHGETLDPDGLLRASIKDMDAMMAKAGTGLPTPAEVEEEQKPTRRASSRRRPRARRPCRPLFRPAPSVGGFRPWMPRLSR